MGKCVCCGKVGAGELGLCLDCYTKAVVKKEK